MNEKIIQKLLSMCHITKKLNTYPAYISKQNLNYEKQNNTQK